MHQKSAVGDVQNGEGPFREEGEVVAASTKAGVVEAAVRAAIEVSTCPTAWFISYSIFCRTLHAVHLHCLVTVCCHGW